MKTLNDDAGMFTSNTLSQHLLGSSFCVSLPLHLLLLNGLRHLLHRFFLRSPPRDLSSRREVPPAASKDTGAATSDARDFSSITSSMCPDNIQKVT